jgi:hypothetical protein
VALNARSCVAEKDSTTLAFSARTSHSPVFALCATVEPYEATAQINDYEIKSSVSPLGP